MTKSAQKRKRRGVILSSWGLQRLQDAQEQLAIAKNRGYAYTLEQLSELTRLSVRSIGRLRSCKAAVDHQTLEDFFGAFNLTLTEQDYIQPEGATEQPPPAKAISQDWGEAPDISHFYGRTAELTTLTEWILQGYCRLVGILGIGGVGKTALSVKLAEQVQERFSYVIWRSLRNAPPIETLLGDLVPFLSNQQETKLELSKLLNCLRQSRCLIILDNLETILDAKQVGQFRSGFEAYGELLRSVAEVGHQSCVILTSREKSAEIAVLEGDESAVRSLRLDGSPEAAQSIIQAKRLIGTTEQKKLLGDRYSNSPLALKIVATSIQELFDRNIGDFLQEDTLVFNGIRRLLDQQFNRLSALEQSIMYWLAINREWTGIAELQADIVPVVPKDRLLESLESLRFRCLSEQQGTRFTQQPVVMEYIAEQLLTTAAQEVERQTLQVLMTHALLKAAAVDYIRESQRQLILEPLIGRLLTQFGSRDAIARHLRQLLSQCQQAIAYSADYYGAGNLLNLLSHLKADLTGSICRV